MIDRPPGAPESAPARRSPGWIVLLALIVMVGGLASIIYFGVR